MGKGRARAVEKGVIGQGASLISNGVLNIPSGPVYYPSEEEFKDPLKYIYKIRPEAEEYGICKIVPPKSWSPPFGLNPETFTFPTKTQAIHQLQARCAPCDSKTFALEYNSFLEDHCGKKSKKRVVFEGADLDLCKLFNAVKRFGGYEKVLKEKKWGEVYRFVKSGAKITECAKHVLSQLYREHLFDYEEYCYKINQSKNPRADVEPTQDPKNPENPENESSSCKRRRKNKEGERFEEDKIKNEPSSLKRKQKEEEYDQICEQCISGLHGEVMLLCDRCNKGWHIYCLSPPLKRVPQGNWYCLDCLNSEKDSFGFVPGKQLSLEAFKRISEKTKKKWAGPGPGPVSRIQLEKKFWEIVEGLSGEVEVMYGSDLDTSIYGSGFPRLNDVKPDSIEGVKWEEYCVNPWNLNNLPKLKDSVLRTVHQNITGVMVPWLYIGMLFSAFCWHFEDHCFYSMNYHHWGEPKCWYSVPGGEADAFEKVMRNSLPDLFDAQPDLLFQLVTMLNPRVLQENNVPVYSVLQEPGNFIITFPRSYHAGFNFGLNCAEAVNFAPADWLPHGGFGSDLYRLYHKAAVLSHEELLCVVAKNGFDNEVSPYLRKELVRVYNKEKTWRELLWKNGVVYSSLMSAKKQPESVGVEEDPTCIICQQFVYLSAVSCKCRPSAFVCLEHWEHLCECKSRKRTLHYRDTLADLSALVHTTDTQSIDEDTKQILPSSDPSSLSKKVKGVYKTHVQLAGEWILKACEVLKKPYENDAYCNVLREAEQFVWAGPEMDPIREMVKSLTEAWNWAEAILHYLPKVENWSTKHKKIKMKKVSMKRLNKLLDLNSVPCDVPGYLKLKDYWLEARNLIQEIDSTLSKSSIVTVTDLEILFKKTIKFPIRVKESVGLKDKLSKAKVWTENLKKCTLEKTCAMVEADFLYKLEKEILELQLQLPERELLTKLINQVELCKFRCNEILKSSMSLKIVEQLLGEFEDFNVNVSELKLLRNYHLEAKTWISRVNNVLTNVHERKDQENVVNELLSIQTDGLSLKIQVEELPRVEIELKRASCRVKAWKALKCKMSINFLETLMHEATEEHINGEKLFTDISRIYEAAISWEERAKQLLLNEAEMFAFEDILRISEGINVILPSLDEVKDRVSMATSWLNKSKPFLLSNNSSNSLLKIEDLKELVSESKQLKISLQESSMLENVLEKCITWENNAHSILREAEALLNNGNTTDTKLVQQVSSMQPVIEAGQTLKFDFIMLPKFQHACATLQWCLNALSFRTITPTLQEVEMFLKVGHTLPETYLSCNLYVSLKNGTIWLKKCLEIADHSNYTQFSLNDAEEILNQSQGIGGSYPLVMKLLEKSIEKHNLWLERVNRFFSLSCTERSWGTLLQLKEIGSTDAYNSSELHMVVSEVEKVEIWKRNVGLVLSYLSEYKSSLDKSFDMYEKLKCNEGRKSCAFCDDLEDEKLLTCYICEDSFHLQCIGSSNAISDDLTMYTCPYCNLINKGKILKSGFGPLKIQLTCLELCKLTELLKDAEDLCLWIEERTILHQIVEKALKNRACLIEIVNFVLTHLDKDLTIVTKKLSFALKAVDLSGVYYSQSESKLDLAFATNSWKIRAQKLLNGHQKSTLQQIQRHLKEGLAIKIPSEEYFIQKLTDTRNIAIHWSETAKKVSSDGGLLGLDKVFDLITEGENLPIYFEKELKLLRERSMLYCICRQPYDQRAMVACDECDEWYHFDCVNLSFIPKVYICPACDIHSKEDNVSSSMIERSIIMGGKFVAPQTPSPQHTEVRSKSKSKSKSNGTQQLLLWRNRKPFRRVVRKRLQFQNLSPFLYVQNNVLSP